MAQTPYNPLEGPRPEITIPLHDGSDERVSIIVVHRNRPEYLNICLQSIAVTSFNNNYEIVVVDNGSGPDTQAFLDDIEKEVKVVRNKENLYWSAACNKGVQKADKGSKYLIFMHSDVVVLNPAWIDLMVNVSESRKAGLVGIERASYIMGTQKVEYIPETVMLVTRECWNDIGPWPEQLPLVGGAFVLSLRASNKGHTPQIMQNPVVHHYKIFGIDISEYERIAEEAMQTIPKLLSEANARPLAKG